MPKPPPPGPAPLAPAIRPTQPITHPSPAGKLQQNAPSTINGAHSTKGKKKADAAPVDPSTMYESVKNRIAALEEESILEEEDERRYGVLFGTLFLTSIMTTFVAEEAQASVKGLEVSAVHAKYLEMVCCSAGERCTDL